MRRGQSHEAQCVRDFENGTALRFALKSSRCPVPAYARTYARCSQAQSHCRQACDYTRHCKRVRVFDNDHVLVLLGPEHLVPDSFWQAAHLLLEPNSSVGGPLTFFFHVPVVTTVPITQVTRFARLSSPSHHIISKLHDILTKFDAFHHRSSCLNGAKRGQYLTDSPALCCPLRRCLQPKFTPCTARTSTRSQPSRFLDSHCCAGSAICEPLSRKFNVQAPAAASAF